MSYLTFVLQERKLLSFGVSLTFFSSFGQTFLISLFVPFFLDAFVLSNAGFGTMYSLATLISAASLPWLGQWIDRIPLRWYSLWVAVGLLFASLIVMVSWHLSVLFLGIIFLRLAGQGLSSHTAQTAMARFYDGQRGKALSVSSIGYPLGEAILPVLIAGLLALVHWRAAWGVIAICVGLIMIPLVYMLIGRDDSGTSNPADSEETTDSARENYSKIFSDNRIWYLIPAVLLPPFWTTGLFLYQVSIASELGWTAGLIATAFISFALFRILGSIGIGPAIDRFSAQSLFPFYMLPMIAGIAIPVFFSSSFSAFVYMGLLGVTMGVGGNIKSALWAELFGSSMIGTVRSLFSSFMVFSTAISPFMVGLLLDMQVPIEYMLIAGMASMLIAGLFSLRIHPRFSAQSTAT
ncbi:MAG: MFS transporter [Balneolaceae bacterium]